MMISTRGRYALRVMVNLARHDSSAYTPLKELAGRFLIIYIHWVWDGACQPVVSTPSTSTGRVLSDELKWFMGSR